ncbi:MAG: hypothetical protein WDW38_006309 [Sanguina aurantia]
MSQAVKVPVGQKRLTNIAVVRLKKGGYRFEIACYKNKVLDWRSGNEKDLDEVLQTMQIFVQGGVGKGIAAKEKELLIVFGTTDEKAICLEILAKGELQVSDKERKQDYDNVFKDVASVLVDKCVNPHTQRPYTLTMLERALRDVHFNVDLKKSAKQQALEALSLLQAQFPIERARMRLRLAVPAEHTEALQRCLDAHDAFLEGNDSSGGTITMVVQVEPGAFRELHTFMQATTQGLGRLEVLSLAVTAEGASAAEFAGYVAVSQPTNAAPSAAAASAAAAASSQQQQQQSPGSSGHDREGASKQQAARESRAQEVSNGSQHGSSTGEQHPPSHDHSRANARSDAKPGSSQVLGQPVASKAAATAAVYPKGSIEGLPEAHASRKERFAELDTLQAGWQVELRNKGDTVEAVFYAPNGEKVGAFANARRMALAAHKLL